MKKRLLALCLAAALAAGCGTSSTPSKKQFKIISLSPTATEMLFAIGAGAQVIAVDDQSNFPPEAPKTDLSGNTPNVEAIAGRQPDLVVIAVDTAGLVAGLKNVGIRTLLLPAATTLDDTYNQLVDLGNVTGHVNEANGVVAKMKGDIAALVGQLPTNLSAKTYYYELDDTFFTATSKTFIGAVIGSTGLKNIGDSADDGSGYPQLAQEKIVQANPDFIFLADTKCCHQSKEAVSQRPGWSTINAVKTSKVITLDDDIASRWGPRVVDLLRTIVEAVKA